MASRAKYASKAAIARAMDAARACGLDVGEVDLRPDGSIRIIEARAVPPKAANDFDRWADRL